MLFENLISIKVLGEGTYGKVEEMVDKETQQKYAVKKVLLNSHEGVTSSTLREIGILYHMNHPNIVKMYDVQQRNGYIYMVMEMLDVDLQRAMDIKLCEFSPFEIKFMFFQILRAINYCHRRHIMHRDLKPHNILLNLDTYKLKLTDFGLAKQVKFECPVLTTEVVTLWYRPPELLLGMQRYGLEVDIWSAAIIWIEMIRAGYSRFDSKIRAIFGKAENNAEMLRSMFEMLGKPSVEEWPELSQLECSFNVINRRNVDWEGIVPGLEEAGVDLLQKMLKYRPQSRISAKDALFHPYFEEVRKFFAMEL
eukprot:TRINITY_DN825_c1_g1_i1.p1 TRINITY_DN825_c1_g1~~TRINITY_DN825_c1_g1_i1.p1  ORF type:complete len:308 (+),score=38.36 TRINITY_DN825_c1_g1_i1:169-1092(+)